MDRFFVSEKTYANINRFMMMICFFVPLMVIAVYEAYLSPSKNRWLKSLLRSPDEGEDDTPLFQNPEPGEEDVMRGMKISKVPFEQLVKALPDTTHVSSHFLKLQELLLRYPGPSQARLSSSRRLES